MRILYISPRPPFPPEGRESVRPYHQIRFLALKHQVDLICFSGGGVDEWDARERLSKLCPRVQIIPLDTTPQDPASVKNLFTLRPLALRRYFRKDLLRRLRAVADTGRYDLVFVYSAAMAPYLVAFPDVPKVVDLVDVGSLRWMEYSNLARFPASTLYRAEATRLLNTELRAAARAQRILLASPEESEVFKQLCPGNARIMPLKTPVNPRAQLKGPWSAEPTIIFAGNLDHFPNWDAAVRLLVEIFPRVLEGCRTTRLIIAGKNPPSEVRSLAERPEVTLIAGRHDLRRLFRRSWLCVAPHRVSRGVRNEVLEAMAVGVPVVASPEAVEGLDVLPGRDLVTASDNASMVNEITRLLTDPIRLDAIGEHGRKSVHNNYSHWNASLRLEEVIHQASAESLAIP
ncbi:MAG: glycosyltransferase [Planctomycetota bacterium]|jgi:sugar transferase (PEP-CTERM/EpsH1 system associated)